MECFVNWISSCLQYLICKVHRNLKAHEGGSYSVQVAANPTIGTHLFHSLNMDPAFSQTIVDPRGDVEIAIPGHTFVVSSQRMSAISPEFRAYFNGQDGPIFETLLLLDKDPKAFKMICQLAHKTFIRNKEVSLETLVEMTAIIQRYEIPSTTFVFQTVFFFFNVRTVGTLLRTIPTPDITALVQAAKNLGFQTYRELLTDIFLLCPICREALPEGSDLKHVQSMGTECLARIAVILRKSPEDELSKFIFRIPRSLLDIKKILQQAMGCRWEHGPTRLRAACDQIDEARATLDLYLLNAAKMEIVGTPQAAREFCSSSMVKRLRVQIACNEHDAETSSAVSVSSTSSCVTEFDDIEDYEKSDEKYDAYLCFNDSESITSSRTI
jgi:hypothetical protein